MGWFDEDDDDEGNEEGTLPASNQISEANGAAAKSEEEDPLDVFMRLNSQELTGGSSRVSCCGSGGGAGANADSEGTSRHRGEDPSRRHRMDLESDDEKADIADTNSLGRKPTYYTSKTTNANGVLFHKAQEQPDGEGFRSTQNHGGHRHRRALPLWTPRDTPRGRTWRNQHDIACSTSVDPLFGWDELLVAAESKREASTTTSSETNELIRGLVSHLQSTIPQPTPVQQQTVPVLLLGQNAVITAATGQGKTLAYLIPAVLSLIQQTQRDGHNADCGFDDSGAVVVVLVPTRELALQVEHTARPLLRIARIKAKSVIGGKESNYDVVKDLKRQDYGLIVASPGRLVDVTKKVTLDPSMVVLDECDKLLQMGFEEQVRQLLSARFARYESSSLSTSTERQMVLLSATLGRNVQAVTREWLGQSSTRVAVGRTGQSSRFVSQHVLVLANEQARTEFCVQMVPTFTRVGRTLIFVATRSDCESLAAALERQAGVRAVTLHGDKHQWDRTSALKDFTSGRAQVLVATDLASRGLDIPEVATVLCVHPAKNLDSHTHRVGRAGRLGKNEQHEGTAYTLLTPEDAHFARVLKGAWEREGRPVSAELDQLALKDAKRARDDDMPMKKPAAAGLGTDAASFSVAPPSGAPASQTEKKGRWGARASMTQKR